MGPNIFATVSEAHLEKIIRILPLLLPLLHSLPLLRGAGVLLEGVFHKRVKHVIQDTSGGKVSHIRALSCTKKPSYTFTLPLLLPILPPSFPLSLPSPPSLCLLHPTCTASFHCVPC